MTKQAALATDIEARQRAELQVLLARLNNQLLGIHRCMERAASILVQQRLGDEGLMLEPHQNGSVTVPAAPGVPNAEEPCVLPTPAEIAKLLERRRTVQVQLEELDKIRGRSDSEATVSRENRE